MNLQQRSDVVEALEVRIEKAWLRLGTLAPKQRVELHLTDRCCIVGWRPQEVSRGAQIIGTYDRSCTLQALREDVFWTLNQRRAA